MKPNEIRINIEDGIYFQLNSKEENEHELKWEVLRDIGDSTQNLLIAIAKNFSSTLNIGSDELKLHFKGFYKGSAIPAFKVHLNPIHLFNSKNAIKKINEELTEILPHIEKENFQEIADRYSNPNNKNEIIDALYHFTNSARSKPFYVVDKKSEDDFEKIIRIKKLSEKNKKNLKIPIDTNRNSQKTSKTEAIGKVTIEENKSGKKSYKVQEAYTEKEAILSFQFDEIEVTNKTYILKDSLLINLKGNEKESFLFESSLLDIFAQGYNIEEAKQDFFEQFDYTYQRLNDFLDENLSKHLRDTKTYINLLVEKIIFK